MLLIIIFVTIIIKNSSQRHSSLQFLLLLTENSQQPIRMRTPTHTSRIFKHVWFCDWVLAKVTSVWVQCVPVSPYCYFADLSSPSSQSGSSALQTEPLELWICSSFGLAPFGRRSGCFHPFPTSHFFVFSHIFSFSLILPSWKRDVRSFSQQVGFNLVFSFLGGEIKLLWQKNVHVVQHSFAPILPRFHQF